MAQFFVQPRRSKGRRLFSRSGDGNTFDNIGRVTLREIGYDDEAATDDRVIVESSETQYDEADNSIAVIGRMLGANGTPTGQVYRVSYVFSWFDGIEREVGTVDYGALTSAPSRPSVTPNTTNNRLVTITKYNDRGEAYSVEDPRHLETRVEFDDLGRRTKLIEHYHGSGQPGTPDADDNRTTTTTYTLGDQIETLTAVMANSTDNEVTTYLYGTTLTDCDIASNDLLREIVYPDGTQGTDSVRLAYNRQRQVIERVDQQGTVHEYRYDGLGRLRHDMVTQAGENIDEAIVRLTTEYEVRGMPAVLSSCQTPPNASGDGGGVVNQVAFSYNDFGQLVKEIQSHDGNLLASDPTVEYTYADGASDSNTIRPTSIIYPGGLEMEYKYDADIDGKLNRIRKIDDDDDLVATYSYLGLGLTVKNSYTQPSASLELWASGSTYPGLDRFNRVVSQHWQSNKAWIQYGYDVDGNRLWRQDAIAAQYPKDFDELYAYDNLNRLTDVQRGLLDAGEIIPGTLKFQQTWGLDPVGNWGTLDQDDNGGGYDLNQARTHNKVNEITGIGEGSGQSQWVTPGYDAAGNTVEFPGVDPAVGYNAYYDAWNRLVKVSVGEGEEELKIAKYTYDARGFRIIRHSYNATTGAYMKRFDDYFNANWQLLETRVGTDSNIPATEIYERYVWHANADGYVDSLLARDRDTNGDGTLDERLYVMQDANFNVVAVCDAAGEVLERYAYTPYGQRTILEPDYDIRTSSGYDWRVGHQGLVHDDSTGLINNRTRVLHSLLGRFNQRDPKEYVDGLNFYQDSKSNTVSNLDPTGLACTCGTDITKTLKQVLLNVEKYFYGKGSIRQARICRGVISGSGWDIQPLEGNQPPSKTTGSFAIDDCGKGNCQGSVTVDGRCYAGGQVNYVLWGRLRAMCGDSYEAATLWPYFYKTVIGGHRDEALEWIYAGYHWQGGQLSAPTTYDKDCKPCSRIYANKLQAKLRVLDRWYIFATLPPFGVWLPTDLFAPSHTRYISG